MDKTLVTIPRDKWLHSVPGRMLDKEGKSCIIGHICLAAGVRKCDLEEVLSPSCLEEDDVELVGLPFLKEYSLLLMGINDEEQSTPLEKEEALQVCCASSPYELEFIDGEADDN